MSIRTSRSQNITVAPKRRRATLPYKSGKTLTKGKKVTQRHRRIVTELRDFFSDP